MNKVLAIILLLVALPALAEEDVTVIWQNPTESVDGSPVEELDRFVLFRQTDGKWEEVGTVPYGGQDIVSGVFTLPCGPSRVAGRVFTVAGVASWLSNKVDYTVDCSTDEPKKPKMPRIISIR